MRYRFTWIVVVACWFACGQNTTDQNETVTEEEPMEEESMMMNQLTEDESNNGWILLFDGKTSSGWRGYQKESFPSKWLVEEGTLHFNPELEGDGGDIVYGTEFSNFHLKLEWKIATNGNSGVFYLGKESEDYIWRTAPEMQVLDNEGHPDANQGKNGNRKAGSLYDLIPADPQNANPANEWNAVEVKVMDREVWHFMNGEEVVHYTIGTDEWNALVADSKFPGLNEDWANVPTSGLIGLQDHGDHVWFRNIKLKTLQNPTF